MESTGKMKHQHKALVIGPNYYNFLNAVSKAFLGLGWDCTVIGYDNPIDPYTAAMKVRYKLGCSSCRKKLRNESEKSFNAKAVAIFDTEAPDLVFIMNGDILHPDTLEHFRSKAKVALWLFDNLSKMPSCRDIAGHCDRLYSFDRRDVAELNRSGMEASFLPQACDTELYYPVPQEKDIDILFVGDLYYYPNRQALLKRVVEEFPHNRILIIGKYKPWYKNPLKWLLREHRDVYTNGNVPASAVNAFYNRARIVLNIHRDDQKDGANPRVFEICGSGAYQICDANPYVRTIFPDGDVGLYADADELVERIREALASDKSEAASRAHGTTMRNHTYANRIEQVISDSGFCS